MKRVPLKKLALFLILCGLFPLGADATQQKIDQVQEGIEDLEKQEKEAQQKADNLSQEAVGLEGDLAEFNNSLAEVVTELNETEQQLAITRQNLKDTRKALKEAGQKETEQYEDMKKRIRFIYEMEQEGMLEALLGAEDFADFLNKAEYFINIHQYDRDMLNAYRQTKHEIAEKKKELDLHQESLAMLLEQQESKKQELDALVADTSQQLNAAKKQLITAQADVAKYESEIKRQKAYEAQLEAQKAEEDAKRLEEIRRQEEENRAQQEKPASQPNKGNQESV